MTKAYYSMVLDHSADDFWQVIRSFDHYAWAGVDAETVIEDGKSGDQVSAVRRVTAGGNVLRQKLLAHSDCDRSYTYCLLDPSPYPVRDYTATIRVADVAFNNKAFIEWWATFDCELGERERWIDHFERLGFSRWLDALSKFMAQNPQAA